MSRPLRVLIVQQAVRGGGAEEVAMAWREVLVRAGHSVTVLAWDFAPADMSPGFRELQGRGSLARLRRIRRVIREESIDVAVSFLTYPNLLLLVASVGLRHLRTVITEHNVPSVLLRAQGPKQRLQLSIARTLYRRATHCVSVSHAIATDLTVNFHVRRDRHSVIPNAVLSVPRELSRAPLPATLSLIAPGRLTAQKRPDVAVRVADFLARAGIDVTLTFVGDERGVSRASLAAQASNARIEFADWSSSWAHDLNSTHSVVLLTSSVEGFGNVLVHAAAARIPSVACSLALGAGDAIIPGVTGCLAATDSVESFAHAVLRAAAIEPEAGRNEWLLRFSATELQDNLGAVLGARLAKVEQ